MEAVERERETEREREREIEREREREWAEDGRMIDAVGLISMACYKVLIRHYNALGCLHRRPLCSSIIHIAITNHVTRNICRIIHASVHVSR